MFAAKAIAAETITGTVVGVHDGDTLTVLTPDNDEVKVRLEGIDAPESKQPFGEASKQSLSAMTFNKPVRLVCTKTDRFKRKVCRVFQDGRDVNRAQLERGMAWHFKRYADEQPAAERQGDDAAEGAARANRRGVFSDPNAVAPWDYRAERR
jgi:endonuclease YncB( thermonuclease family)